MLNMKKKVKYILFASVALFLVGVIIFVVGMSQLKWDWRRLDNTPLESKQVRFEKSKINSLHINTRSLNVRIAQGGDDFVVDYFESEFIKNDVVDVVGSQLQIDLSYSQPWSIFDNPFSGIKVWNSEIVITVPQDVEVNSIFATASNSNFKVSNATVGELSVSMANGNFEIENLTAKNLDVKLSNGNFEVEKMSVTQSSIDMKNGNFVAEKIDMVSTDNDMPSLELDINNGNTKIAIKGKSSDFIIATNIKNGYSSVNNQAPDTATKKIQANIKNGNFKLDYRL